MYIYAVQMSMLSSRKSSSLLKEMLLTYKTFTAYQLPRATNFYVHRLTANRGVVICLTARPILSMYLLLRELMLCRVSVS